MTREHTDRGHGARGGRRGAGVGDRNVVLLKVEAGQPFYIHVKGTPWSFSCYPYNFSFNLLTVTVPGGPSLNVCKTKDSESDGCLETPETSKNHKTKENNDTDPRFPLRQLEQKYFFEFNNPDSTRHTLTGPYQFIFHFFSTKGLILITCRLPKRLF